MFINILKNIFILIGYITGISGDLNVYASDDNGVISSCVNTGHSCFKVTCRRTVLYGSTDWLKDGEYMTQCSDYIDKCIPQTSVINSRYTFTTNISLKEYYFHVANFNIIDQGNYTCFEAGLSTSGVAYIAALCVPVTSVAFSIPPERSITTRENVTIQLQCTTSVERPRSTIQWFITGRVSPIGIGAIQPTDNDTLGSTVGTLSYRFGRTDNGRQLYCSAYNFDGHVAVESTKKEIIVEYGTSGPPVIIGFNDGDTYTAILSRQQIIVCSVTGGNPPPSLTWNCFSGIETNDSVGPNEIRKRVTWMVTKSSGSSSCRCVSNQKISGQQQVTISVDVLYPPSLPAFSISGTAVRDTVKIIQGNDLVIKCESTSNPVPTYEWTNSKTTVKLSAQLLSIQGVSLSDEMSYTCTAFNIMVPAQGSFEKGSFHSSFNLDVLHKPDVNLLQDQFIKENDHLSVSCTALGNPEPASFTWMRSKDSFRQQSSDLLIKATRREDTDIYTCIASNIMTPTVGAQTIGTASRTMTVTILYHPDVVVLLLNGTTVTENNTNIVLKCSAKGEPQQYKFYNWVQYTEDSGTKVKEYSSTLVEGGTAYLVFQTVSYMDTGNYHCFVENGIEDYRTGNVSAANNTVLHVKARPVVTDGSRDVSALLHGNATLWVAYYSNDMTNFSIKWYKIENDVKRNVINTEKEYVLTTSQDTVTVAYYAVKVRHAGHMSQLFIQNVTKRDFGEYEIALSNSVGTTIWNLNLNAPVPSELTEDSSAGAVAGGVTAGVLVLTAIVATLLIWRRYGRNHLDAGCWNKKTSNENSGTAFTTLGAESARRNVDKEETNLDSRTGVSQYEVLNSERELSQPYEGIQTSVGQTEGEMSSVNVYEELDQTKRGQQGTHDSEVFLRPIP